MIEIVYFGADDCFYCQHWEAARKPELLALIRGRSARLVEVRGESLEKPILERHYPPQLRWPAFAFAFVVVNIALGSATATVRLLPRVAYGAHEEGYPPVAVPARHVRRRLPRQLDRAEAGEALGGGRERVVAVGSRRGVALLGDGGGG